MSVGVIEVTLGEDGVWETLELAVYSPQDIPVVESLDPFQPVDRAPVRHDGDLHRLTVYRTGPVNGYVKRSDLD